VLNFAGLTRIEGPTVLTEPTKIAVKILDIFEAQAESRFAISVLALATLLCATLHLMQRRRRS
jgi:hypothetical protein